MELPINLFTAMSYSFNPLTREEFLMRALWKEYDSEVSPDTLRNDSNIFMARNIFCTVNGLSRL